MNFFQTNRINFIRKLVCGITAGVFSATIILPPAYAQSVLNLPNPGTSVSLSPSFTPVILKGIKISTDNPLHFDFIVDTGDQGTQSDQLRDESNKIIKYFLASLTVPEDELWVNLSPYEGDRIIPDAFGITEMGRDLLAQDYMLKQISASLMHPEKELGREFWKQVHAKVLALYGNEDVPVDTFNKIWIIPEKGVVYVKNNTAFVVESRLKVLLENDYVALKDSLDKKKQDERLQVTSSDAQKINDVTGNIVREIILPAIEKEVNEGKNFAQLRQIFNSLILASWYKKNLKESFLGKNYVAQNKIEGIDIADKSAKEKIYQQYVKAFESGVYDFIKEDYDQSGKSIIPRKYFSGGFDYGTFQAEVVDNATMAERVIAVDSARYVQESVDMRPIRASGISPVGQPVTAFKIPMIPQSDSAMTAVLDASRFPEKEFLTEVSRDGNSLTLNFKTEFALWDRNANLDTTRERIKFVVSVEPNDAINVKKVVEVLEGETWSVRESQNINGDVSSRRLTVGVEFVLGPNGDYNDGDISGNVGMKVSRLDNGEFRLDVGMIQNENSDVVVEGKRGLLPDEINRLNAITLDTVNLLNANWNFYADPIGSVTKVGNFSGLLDREGNLLAVGNREYIDLERRNPVIIAGIAASNIFEFTIQIIGQRELGPAKFSGPGAPQLAQFVLDQARQTSNIMIAASIEANNQKADKNIMLTKLREAIGRDQSREVAIESIIRERIADPIKMARLGITSENDYFIKVLNPTLQLVSRTNNSDLLTQELVAMLNDQGGEIKSRKLPDGFTLSPILEEVYSLALQLLQLPAFTEQEAGIFNRLGTPKILPDSGGVIRANAADADIVQQVVTYFDGPIELSLRNNFVDLGVIERQAGDRRLVFRKKSGEVTPLFDEKLPNDVVQAFIVKLGRLPSGESNKILFGGSNDISRDQARILIEYVPGMPPKITIENLSTTEENYISYKRAPVTPTLSLKPANYLFPGESRILISDETIALDLGILKIGQIQTLPDGRKVFRRSTGDQFNLFKDGVDANARQTFTTIISGEALGQSEIGGADTVILPTYTISTDLPLNFVPKKFLKIIVDYFPDKPAVVRLINTSSIPGKDATIRRISQPNDILLGETKSLPFKGNTSLILAKKLDLGEIVAGSDGRLLFRRADGQEFKLFNPGLSASVAQSYTVLYGRNPVKEEGEIIDDVVYAAYTITPQIPENYVSGRQLKIKVDYAPGQVPQITLTNLSRTETKVISFVQEDNALLNRSNPADFTKGGVDLNPNFMTLNAQGESATFKVPQSIEELNGFPVGGFTPEIRQIIPAPNVLMFLGINAETKPLPISS